MAYRFNQADNKCFGDIRGAAAKLTERIQDMQSSWDNRTEQWQESERGQAVQDWLTEMENKIREISDCVDDIEDSEPTES